MVADAEEMQSTVAHCVSLDRHDLDRDGKSKRIPRCFLDLI